MQDVSRRDVEAWRAAVGAPPRDSEEYTDWLINSDASSIVICDAPSIVIVQDDELTVEELETQGAIEYARGLVLDGVNDEVSGRLKIVKGLLALKEADRWKDDPLVCHLENPGWKEYLEELIQWMKECNPNIQCGLSTLMNYMRYHQVWVEGYGFDEALVFGASEHTRRALHKMFKGEYGGGMPVELRGDFDLRKLPLPPDWTGEEPSQARLRAGVRGVAEQAFGLGRYSPDLFDAYKSGNGRVRVDVSMRIMLDKEGVPVEWTAFVKKHDQDGNPLESYARDLFTEEMPVEVLDWLEKHGCTVEMDA